mgnify:CR=1 FL=1|nr:MAG TPA: Single strand binding protein [Caudoviricetes sp.]
MNKVILAGRFTRDPEIRYTNDGASIARFSIAVNRRFVKEGSDQKADFLNCIAFGKTAEFIEKYFSKGMKADLSGRIQTGSYTNKDGAKVYTTDIVVEEIEFGESKNATQNNNRSSGPAAAPDDFINVPDDLGDEFPF